MLKYLDSKIIISLAALINEAANEAKIIISLMFHIIQETQTPSKKGNIAREIRKLCEKLYNSLPYISEKPLPYFAQISLQYFAQVFSIFCTNRFHILQKFFQVFSDAFVGDVWPTERQITNDGQPGRGWQKVSRFL